MHNKKRKREGIPVAKDFWALKADEFYGTKPISLAEATKRADSFEKRAFCIAFLYKTLRARHAEPIQILAELTLVQTMFPPLAERKKDESSNPGDGNDSQRH